jgi:hypothetical protein
MRTAITVPPFRLARRLKLGSWLSQMDKPPGCVWCGCTPLDREHILSRPIRAHLPKLADQQYATFNPVQDTLTVHTSHKGQGLGRGWIAKCVCKRCNSGWMRHLDHTVAEDVGTMIAGEDIELNPSRAQAFAQWAAKIAILSCEPSRSLKDASRQATKRWRRRAVTRVNTDLRRFLPLTGSFALVEYTSNGQVEVLTLHCTTI